MAEQTEKRIDDRNLITVKSDISDLSQQVDEYVAELPVIIREQMRQALYKEYESDYEAEERLCRQMLETVPDNADVLALLGRSLLSQRRMDEAQKALEKALEIDPDQDMVRVDLGIVYHAQAYYDKAVKEFEKIDPPSEYHPFFNSTYGESLENLNRREKAREVFNREIRRYEDTGEIPSEELLDGCFSHLIFLDAVLGRMELNVDTGIYKRFLSKIEMNPQMRKHLTQNIAFWSTALTVRTFREPFRSIVRTIEEEGYLLDSDYYYIIENAYRSVESYEYHEDRQIDAITESFLSAESHAPLGNSDTMEDTVDREEQQMRAAALTYEWYMSKDSQALYAQLPYIAEHYPHTYARLVTFLDQLRIFGPEKLRNVIEKKMQMLPGVHADEQEIRDGLEKSYKTALAAKKEPVYIAEGNVTYRRGAKKIMPNDPCPCGSGKKYKNCHGRRR